MGFCFIYSWISSSEWILVSYAWLHVFISVALQSDDKQSLFNFTRPQAIMLCRRWCKMSRERVLLSKTGCFGMICFPRLPSAFLLTRTILLDDDVKEYVQQHPKERCRPVSISLPAFLIFPLPKLFPRFFYIFEHTCGRWWCDSQRANNKYRMIWWWCCW